MLPKTRALSALILKKNYSESVYNKRLLKTEKKSYCNEATDFDDKEMPKAGSGYTSSAVINVDSALKRDKNYCPQVLLKECK